MVAGPGGLADLGGDAERVLTAGLGEVVGEVVDHLLHPDRIGRRERPLGQEAADVGVAGLVDVDAERGERNGGGGAEAVLTEVRVLLGVVRLADDRLLAVAAGGRGCRGTADARRRPGRVPSPDAQGARLRIAVLRAGGPGGDLRLLEAVGSIGAAATRITGGLRARDPPDLVGAALD